MSVIVLIADGARVDTLSGAIDSGALPAMADVRRDGALYGVTSAFPSVTGPAYAPFLMGRFPGSVGLPGLRWFDRSREACSFPDYTRSYVGYQIGAVDRDIDPAASTIFELVPDSIGGLSVITRGLPPGRQLMTLTARSAWRAVRTHFRGDLHEWLRVDRDIAQGVIDCVRTRSASFVFAAFQGVDKMSHARGHASEDVVDALRIIDRTVGALRDDLEQRGLWDETSLWITSDHGHSRVRHHEDLARLVGGLGYRVLAHPWVYRLGADVAVMVSGNAMAHVYVDLERRDRPFRDGLSPRGRALAQHLLGRDSVDLLLTPVSDTLCEVRSRDRGNALVSQLGDRFAYHVTDGDPLGIGRDLVAVTAAEAHDATIETDYPDSVVQIARLAGSERAGDFILSAARDWDFRARYEPIPHVSSHGALHREHMMVPLLMNRPGARTPRRTADVMPSALAALGRAVPAGLDGESFVHG